MPFDISAVDDPDMKAGIEEFVANQIKAREAEISSEYEQRFKTDIDALKGNNSKLVKEKTEEEKRRKAAEAVYGERDPQKVAEMLSKMETDEELALLNSGDVEAFKQRVAERERVAGKALVDAERQQREEAQKQAAAFKQQIHDLTISNAIKSAYTASGGVKDEKAQEYAAIEAAKWWSINADGQKECRDPVTKELVTGKSGLMSEAEWVQEKLRPTASFMFEGVVGSGANGGSKGRGGKPFSELSIEEQSARVDEHNGDLEAAMAH